MPHAKSQRPAKELRVRYVTTSSVGTDLSFFMPCFAVFATSREASALWFRLRTCFEIVAAEKHVIPYFICGSVRLC